MMTKEQRGLLTYKLSIPDEHEDKDLPPLDAALEEKLIAQTQALLAGTHRPEGKVEAKSSAAREPGGLAPVIDLNKRREAHGGAPQPKARPGKVRSRRPLRWMAPVWGTCAAACLCFWLWGPTGAPLVPYQLTVRSEAPHLGAPLGGSPASERIRLYVDSRLQVELRPIEKVSGSLQVAAYRRGPGSELQRWPQGDPVDPGSTDSQGIIRLDKSVQDSGLTPGRWQLIYVIGRQRRLPTDSEVRSLLLSGQPTATSTQWQIRSIFVDVTAQR